VFFQPASALDLMSEVIQKRKGFVPFDIIFNELLASATNALELKKLYEEIKSLSKNENINLRYIYWLSLRVVEESTDKSKDLADFWNQLISNPQSTLKLYSDKFFSENTEGGLTNHVVVCSLFLNDSILYNYEPNYLKLARQYCRSLTISKDITKVNFNSFALQTTTVPALFFTAVDDETIHYTSQMELAQKWSGHKTIVSLKSSHDWRIPMFSHIEDISHFLDGK
jgi:hypothetical protein